MKRKMFLRLPEHIENLDEDARLVSWVIVDEEQEEDAVVHSGKLNDVSSQAAGCFVIVLVPATNVILNTVNVPSRNRSDILNAVPYSLEDSLAEDVDGLHFAIAERDANGNVPVAAVSENTMLALLAMLRDTGIDPGYMTSEIFCVPIQPLRWGILIEDEQILLRDEVYSGISFDRESIAEILSCVWHEKKESRPDVVAVIDVRTIIESDDAELKPEESYSGDGSEHIKNTVPLAIPLNDCEIDYQFSERGALQLMAKNFDENAAINLIQGHHSRQEQLGRIFRPWLATAALFILLLVIGGGKKVTEYFYLSNQNEALVVKIESIYKDAFPEAKRIVNARIQMQQKLDELKKTGGTSSNDFLSLLSNVGATLKSHPAEITRLVYRNKNIDVGLSMSDMQLLDKMEKSLEQSGELGVEIRSATQKNGKVEAQLKIKRSTP